MDTVEGPTSYHHALSLLERGRVSCVMPSIPEGVDVWYRAPDPREQFFTHHPSKRMRAAWHVAWLMELRAKQERAV